MTTTAPAASASRILVVDDELGPRESLRMLLKPSYQIRTADNGRAALEEIPRFRPDLVILDIKMAEMDGLEVLSRIKHLDPTIEVVMITAYASLETVKLALTHGAFEYLQKPFHRQELENVVKRALHRRQTDLGRRGEVAKLVEEMRALASKARALEETARHGAVEQSLRVTQLSILREISRTIVQQLDPYEVTSAITEQLRAALGYDAVTIVTEAPAAPRGGDVTQVVCAIQDAEGTLGYLVSDNRSSQRPIDPHERELLEMLAEYLAIALRNSRLYGQIDETKRSLEQLVECAGDAIISVTAGDMIAGWNPAAERIFGLGEAEAVGRSITEILSPVDYEEAKRRLVKGTPMHAFETMAVGGRTSSTALAVTLSGFHGRRGGLEGLIAIVRDITREREVENKRHQAEKLTALGQLAGGIAHDFNNLLQAILGYSQLMKQNVNDPSLMQRALQIVESAALDGSETVRRIQQFARLRPDEPFVRVDVNQIAQDAIAITRPRWEERIAHDKRPVDLRLDLGTVPAVKGRPAALTELMTNLILNAMDAMPEGGTLSIATRRGDDKQAVITVADTGIGMPEAVQQRIFEPFFSTKGEGGSGLGLSMSYSIAKRHGGDIRVESEPGRGTTFTLSLPAADEATEATEVGPGVARRRHARVLVVDDEPQVLATLAELLQDVGHTVTTAPGGAAALAAHARGRFDVILSNLGMAGMNGWELAERLRETDRDVAVLFITGWGLRDEDRARLGALDVHRCLFKPAGPVELDAAVQSALESS